MKNPDREFLVTMPKWVVTREALKAGQVVTLSRFNVIQNQALKVAVSERKGERKSQRGWSLKCREFDL